MPELTHDTAEDGFHEIQLSGKQLVFLFMATTVVLVVTFLCGVLVGRDIEADRIGGQPVDTATLDQARDDQEAASPPPVIGDGPTSTPGPLTYDRRLSAETPSEKLTDIKPQPEVEPPAAGPPAQTAATPPPAAQPPQPPEEKLDVPTSGRPGTWFLQISALRNRSAAADTVRRLIAKGYPAYLENPAAGASPLYRVRIGRYGDRDEAEKVAQRLQKEEQFTSDIRR